MLDSVNIIFVNGTKYKYRLTSITRDGRSPNRCDRKLTKVAIIELLLLKIWEKKFKIGQIMIELEPKMSL